MKENEKQNVTTDQTEEIEQSQTEQTQAKSKSTLLQVVKFTLFSLSAGLIELAVFALLNDAFKIENYWACYLPALVLSVLWNFTFNRKFTFKSANNVPVAMAKVALFYLIFTPLSTWGGNALAEIGVHEYIILAGTMVLNFVLEFLYSKFWVFNPKYDVKKNIE